MAPTNSKPPPLPHSPPPISTSFASARDSSTAPAPGEEDVKRRVSRKLQKRRRDGTHSPTMELPDRFRDGEPGDAEEEIGPHMSRMGTGVGMSGGGNMFMNMNQSIFGLLAAAGSRVDFNDRFEGQSSDSEEDIEDAAGKDSSSRASQQYPHTHTHAHAHAHPRSRLSSGREAPIAQTTVLEKPDKDGRGRHLRKISESKLLRSLPTLSRRLSSKKSKSKPKQPVHDKIDEDPESSPPSPTDGNEVHDPKLHISRQGSKLAPVMSRMLEARAEMSARPSFDLDRDRMSTEQARDGDPGDSGPSPLARKLREIFLFDDAEEVIEEYPCWLLQSVLLQGYMYITTKHICFYAYLPKKAHEVAKSGYLSKSGKRNPAYNRYWFRLKGDVLAYYKDPSNQYFPHGQIDLRYGISANITDKDKDSVHFEVVTHQRTYHFRADSKPSAKEWVKSLQRVIFRSHNDGDSVKISLPIENVIDIEESPMLDFADTCKIRVIDNDETYAIDEYFFSFFERSTQAVDVLKILIEDSSARSGADDKLDVPRTRRDGDSKPSTDSSPQSIGVKSPKVHEAVKATLSPLSPPQHSSPRASGDFTRSSFDALRFGRKSTDLGRHTIDAPGPAPRRSFSDGRRSLSRNRLGDRRRPPEVPESSESYVQSMEDPSIASGLLASSSEDPSASQILRGSEVFQSPTMRRSTSASRTPPLSQPGRQVHHEQSHSTGHPTTGLGVYRHHAATTGSFADPGAGESADQLQAATPSLQSLSKMGAYPLQRAGAFAQFLNSQSRRMSSLLANESMGYVEKVSGMWRGERRHYDEPAELRTDDEHIDGEDDLKVATSMDRFRAHFALPETEKLQATYFGFLHRVLPLYGKIYISDRSFCFRSLLPGTRTKLILPLKDIENVHKEKGFRFGFSGLVVVIKGHEEIFFEFNEVDSRDDCAITVLQSLEGFRFLQESGLLAEVEQDSVDAARAERDALQEARHDDHPPETDAHLPHTASTVPDAPTILFDDPRASFVNFKPHNVLNITCLTIGSRGDVQPYIALSKGLLAEGHRVTIATHSEFQGWIESHGIGFRRIEGDPSELMRICIENGTFTYAFFKEANAHFRGWLDELLLSAWTACQGADLLIESPSTMAGIHIAEALQIPYFRAFTMPWTRTRAYPHAFMIPGQKMGGAYNYITYVMFDNVFWKATAHQVNRWRNNTLGLPNTSLEKMQPNKVPFLYNFSPCVVPPPLDYSDWIRVTGYWFLDEGGAGSKQWTPPQDLVDFIERARADGKKLVYVGFGSIIVPDAAKMTRDVIEAVQKADVRCVLSKGWSDRIVGRDRDPGNASVKEAGGPQEKEDGKDEDEDEDKTDDGVRLPPEIFQIKSAPHDWLFARMDAAAHHGGSGTTGASLRAGVPTIIRPFFGDQFFFGSRVEDLGVGIALKKWGAWSFGKALFEATRSERMISKAKVLGEHIRKENGVEAAIQCIYRDLDYARTLVEAKASKNARLRSASSAAVGATDAHLAGGAAAAAAATDVALDALEDDEDAEESWTFVGAADELDPEAVLKKSGTGAGEEGSAASGASAAGSARKKALGSRVLGGLKGHA